MADSIQDAIEQSAKRGIASVTVEGQTTVAQTLSEQIAADKHLANKRAAASGHTFFGIRTAIIERGGTG